MKSEHDRNLIAPDQERAAVLDDLILHMSRDEARAYVAEYCRARGLPEPIPAERVPPVDESRSA